MCRQASVQPCLSLSGRPRALGLLPSAAAGAGIGARANPPRSSAQRCGGAVPRAVGFALQCGCAIGTASPVWRWPKRSWDSFVEQRSEAQMHRTWQRTGLVLALCLIGGNALAQGAGAPAAGATSTPGSAPTARPASPAAGAPSPNPSAPLNTDTFPTSRLLSAPAPSTTPGAPSGVAGTPSPGTSTPPPAPGGADPNLPATASGGRPQGERTRTGKNPINERYDDCVKLWDSRTHMSKAEWSRTCRRIENRLQNLQVENLDVDVSGPKPRRTGKSPGGRG
jgi:hypothetical protein